jgi:hypothetical protein
MAALMLAAALLFAGSAHGATDEAFAGIQARLEKHAVVRAEFVQMRTMKDLQRPQLSRGQLVSWTAGGVIWQVEQPFKTTYILREERTIEIAADGRRTERSAIDDRGAARIGRVLRAVLKGDAKALDDLFETRARVEGERWSLVLVPRNGPMAYFVKSIDLYGGEFIEGVRITEENGDATHMQFRNPRAADAPSEHERQLLTGE